MQHDEPEYMTAEWLAAWEFENAQGQYPDHDCGQNHPHHAQMCVAHVLRRQADTQR